MSSSINRLQQQLSKVRDENEHLNEEIDRLRDDNDVLRDDLEKEVLKREEEKGELREELK